MLYGKNHTYSINGSLSGELLIWQPLEDLQIKITIKYTIHTVVLLETHMYL